jgi:hypothetical protein
MRGTKFLRWPRWVSNGVSRANEPWVAVFCVVMSAASGSQLQCHEGASLASFFHENAEPCQKCCALSISSSFFFRSSKPPLSHPTYRAHGYPTKKIAASMSGHLSKPLIRSLISSRAFFSGIRRFRTPRSTSTLTSLSVTSMVPLIGELKEA